MAMGYIHYGDFTEYILDSFFRFHSCGMVVALFHEFIYEYGFAGTDVHGKFYGPNGYAERKYVSNV